MITEAERRAAAAALMRADRDRRPITQLSLTYPDLEIVDAYAIQQLWAAERVAAGARLVGHKIGLTSRAMQMASQMTEPDYGFLTDDMVVNDGAVLDASRYTKPRLEVELAFVLGADLYGPDLRVHDVLRATEYIVPALEVIEAVEKAIGRIRAAGRPAGVLTTDPTFARRCIDLGTTFAAVGVDVGLLARGADTLAQTFRHQATAAAPPAGASGPSEVP